MNELLLTLMYVAPFSIPIALCMLMSGVEYVMYQCRYNHNTRVSEKTEFRKVA